MSNRLTIILLILISFSSSAFAQSDDPLGCATEKSKTLAFMVGEWKVRSNFRTSRRDNKWEKTEATSVIKQRFKECVYEELLTGERNGRPHQLLGLYSYNNLSDKLQWVGGHSEHGVLTLYEGEFVDDELILEYSMMLRSRLIHFRIVITKTREGFDLRSERSSDKKLWDAGWYRNYKKI